jgi:excisionase family DNA binding protein
MKSVTESPWLTVQEAADYLRYSKTAIRAACANDVLRHVQPGGVKGKILTKREWLDAWCAAHEHGG